MEYNITEATRQAIFGHILDKGIKWSGCLSEVDFLKRLYDLTQYPSNDHRYNNAQGDISVHRGYWHDWDEDWVLKDNRFRLSQVPDEKFLKFICETIHPVVRTDPEEALEIAYIYNQHLKAFNWKIFQTDTLEGKPIFSARKIGKRETIIEEPIGWPKVQRQLQEVKYRLMEAKTEEQFQVVGHLCREVLISVAEEAYQSDKHGIVDDVKPSKTDAERRIAAIFNTELKGKTYEEARSHAKSTLKLANTLQHKRTADFKMASLAGEATASVVNLVAILTDKT